MSLRGSEMVKRWKERHRSSSGTPTLTDPPPSASRPTTAVNSWAEYNNHALPKIVESAVLAAFSSDVFRDAVASMIEPALSKQQEKLNQLKLANLNLESTLQTRLDELPLLLQPAIDHITAVKASAYGTKLEKLSAGQDGCLHLLETFDERIDGLENQLRSFDGRMKALEDKVVSADLRSAIRFGEISNELQGRNTTLNDRLWELEREVGGKIDGQQRRVVGLCEDLSKAVRKTEDAISALEMMHAATNEEHSHSNSKLLDNVEIMRKSVSKLDATENSLRRDINAVSVKVSSLDTTPLEFYPRKFEAIERTLSSLKDEVATQGTLASLDSKLLSANNARLEAVASSVTKVGYLVESVREEVSGDDEHVELYTEKLELLDSKMAELIAGFGVLQKEVSSLDTSALTSHSAQLGHLASSMIRINGHLQLLDAKLLASQSEALDALKSTVVEMQANNDVKLSSQNQSLSSIVAILEETKLATSNVIESVANTVGKIYNVTVSTQDALSSRATTLENTSQTLRAFQIETSNTLKPFSSILEDITARIGTGNDTLSTLDQSIEYLVSRIACQGSDLAELKKIISISDVTSALKTVESTQAAASNTLKSSLQETQKSMQEIHGSTMSEIRHRNASILVEIQKSNDWHTSHAVRFVEAKLSRDAHAKALEDGFASLGIAGKESRTCIDSISVALDTAKHTNTAHGKSLEEIFSFNQKHQTSLAELSAKSSEFRSGQEKSIFLTEMNSSTTATLEDSIPKKEHIKTLQTNFGNVIEILGKQNTAPEGLGTTESVSLISNQLAQSDDILASNANSRQGEFKTLKTLSETNASIENGILAENTQVSKIMSEILEEFRSDRVLMEKRSSTARAEGTAIKEEIETLKSLVVEANLSSEFLGIMREMADIKGLIKDVQDGAKFVDDRFHPMLNSVTDASERASSSMSAILVLLESIGRGSASAPVLKYMANLRSFVEEHHAASLSPEILRTARAIEEAIIYRTQSIKDNEDAILKSIMEVRASLLEHGVSSKADIDCLAADLKRLDMRLATSTDLLREDLKAVDGLVQANGQAIEKTHSKLSKINTTISRIGVDTDVILAEHIPRLRQTIQAIDLNKLDLAAVESGKALTSISTTLRDLSQVSKGHDVLISELDRKVVLASDFASNGITKLQISLRALDTTLAQSSQEAAKTHQLLQSNIIVLENIKSDIQSINSSTSSALLTLSTSLSSIYSEINTITPAVRINSAAISRVDHAVLETGAQVKSLVLEGDSKVSREIDAALEQLDESLHDSGTRIRGISDFDFPRLEQTVKGLETMVERIMGGNLKLARRNRDALSVIGARVVGTQKMFDEMVESQGREDGERSLESSGVLSSGARPEHRRLGSGRFRAASNASSGKGTAGSGVKAVE